MKARGSLQRQLVLAAVLYGVVLGTTYLFVVPRLLFHAEDQVFGAVMGAEIERLQRLGSDQETLPAGMRVHDSVDTLPADLRVALGDQSLRIVEVLDVVLVPGGEVTDCLVVGFEWRGATRYLVYDVGAVEPFDDSRGDPEFLWLIVVGGGVFVVGTIWFLRIARRVGRSLKVLEEVAAATATADVAPLLAKLSQDEAGAIARAFAQARDRLSRALERERRFTGDASHELRTPVTIIRGATELLAAALPQDSARAHELIRRIEAATGQVEELLVAFLWLARSEDQELGDERQQVELEPVVCRVLDSLAQAEGVDRGDLPVDLQVAASGALAAPPRVVDIVLRNLLQNAIRHAHTMEGRVTVGVGASAIVIANPTGGDAVVDTDVPHGFGLAIVRDLCKRFGWTIDIRHADGRFEVRVASRADSDRI